MGLHCSKLIRFLCNFKLVFTCHVGEFFVCLAGGDFHAELQGWTWTERKRELTFLDVVVTVGVRYLDVKINYGVLFGERRDIILLYIFWDLKIFLFFYLIYF